MKINEKYLDKDIYTRAKRKIDMEHKKHSAFKSMAILKEYKSMGGRIKEGTGKKGTTKWLKEDWRNLTPYTTGKVTSIAKTPKCGVKGEDQKLPSICRPTKKVDSKTPQLAQTYSKTQLKKALEQKKKGKTIQWKNL
jgi:hypothetical protein